MDFVSALNIEVGQVTMRGGGSKKKRKSRTEDNFLKEKSQFLCDIPEDGKDMCFFYAIALGLCDEKTFASEEHRKLILEQIIKTRLKMHGYSLPFSLRKLKSFERRHASSDFAVNVYTCLEEDGDMTIFPVHKSIFKQRAKNINILYLPKSQHFVYVSDLDGLCRAKYQKNKPFTCFSCMWEFSTSQALERHNRLCDSNTRLEYPSKGDSVKFQSFNKRITQPIYGVLDFESSLVPVSRLETAVKYGCVNCARKGPVDDCKHATAELHAQTPSTFCIMFADTYGEIIYNKTLSSQDNLMVEFFSVLSNLETDLFQRLQRFQVKTDYTAAENEEFLAAAVCHLCEKPFIHEDFAMKPVRDHCHYTNRYLGAAHNRCNFQRQDRHRIPVFVHNFKNYDSHFILEAANSSSFRFSGLPANFEKFRTLSLNKFSFVDSAELIPGALADLVSTLSSSDHPFSFLDQMSFCTSEDSKKLLLRKGLYPYEWASSIQKLVENKRMPAREDFFSVLTQKGITEEDYSHACSVFEHFHCNNMLDYCELYCTLDTVLLLEVINSFRKVISDNFKLDVTQYISTPQLAYDCMLTTLKKPIEKMSDPDMVLMCEQNIRGGVSFINVRQSCPEKVKTYLDANNLYSVAQMDYVPVGDFAWCNSQEMSELASCVKDIPDDADKGYILCVDLQYPMELHDDHSSMPLAPEQMDISYDDLSPYAQACLESMRGKAKAHNYKSRKLCSTLSDKKEYVLHYRNLKFYLSQGLVLTKIHRAFSFCQAPVLQDFIRKCTDKRQEAVSKVEKNYWKLICNSVYGKFIQDNRKHFNVKFTTTAKSFQKNFSMPWFKGHRIINENFVTVFMDKEKIVLDRLYAIGFTILELSKLHMYASYYDFFLPALGGPGQVELVLTDTDSLVLQVSDMSRDEMFERITPIMDFSNYPRDHPLFSDERKAIPGYFKDENGGNFLKEVVGLKAKCYAMDIEDWKSTSHSTSVVCKGVGKVGRNNLTLDMYKECLESFKSLKAVTYNIQAFNHRVFTQRIKKVALSTLDDKRFLLDCGKHTLPHGHYQTSQFVCPTCK
jgi:hypothetical protein